MPTPPLPPRRPRPAAAAVVLALHLLGAGLLLRLGTWPDREPPPAAGPALWLRLLPHPARHPAPHPTPHPAPQPAQHQPTRPLQASPRPTPPIPAQPPRAALQPRQRPADDALQAITAPAAGATPGLSAAAPPSPPSSAAAPAAPPLNLALPRDRTAPWRQHNPALDDPRANTAPLTLEQRVADAMGGDAEWVEEPIDADHRRLRRGRTCIYLQRPRAAQIDPFHPANRALPWQAGTPVRC